MLSPRFLQKSKARDKGFHAGSLILEIIPRNMIQGIEEKTLGRRENKSKVCYGSDHQHEELGYIHKRRGFYWEPLRGYVECTSEFPSVKGREEYTST